MIEVRAEIQVDRAVDEVFDYLSDMHNNPEWQKGMRSCEWTSEPPLRVGSTYDQEARFLGKEIRTSFEVTEFEPGRCLRIVSTSGPMPIDVTRRVVPETAGSCSVSATIRGDSRGLFRLAEPVMKLVVKSSVNADYRRLKRTLEGAPRES